MNSLEGHRIQLPSGKWATVVREVWDGELLLEVAYRVDGEVNERRLYLDPGCARGEAD